MDTKKAKQIKYKKAITTRIGNRHDEMIAYLKQQDASFNLSHFLRASIEKAFDAATKK